MLKTKVFLLVGAVTAAHCAGAIPHEKAILSWGAATGRLGWHRLHTLARTTYQGQPKLASIALVMWSKARDFAEGNSYIASSSAYPRKPDPSSLAPPRSLKRVNEEYRKLLLVHRRQVSPGAPAVRFDLNLFQGCYAFNQLLERTNVLRHDPDQPGAEIAGVSTAPLVRDDAPALARFIWTQFAASPQHAAIQADTSLTRVAVSVTSHYFLVRFQPAM